MKTFDAFLKPKRKENLKFVLSDVFTDEDGNPIEWEMRQLSATEGIEISKNAPENYTELMAVYVSNALVVPNLKDKDLLSALSAREGRTILKPVDALKCIVTDAELARLVSLYIQHNDLGTNFTEKVEEAKN